MRVNNLLKDQAADQVAPPIREPLNFRFVSSEAGALTTRPSSFKTNNTTNEVYCRIFTCYDLISCVEPKIYSSNIICIYLADDHATTSVGMESARMESSMVLVACFLIAAAFVSFWKRRRCSLDSRIPGPPSIPLLGNLLQIDPNPTALDAIRLVQDLRADIPSEVWLRSRCCDSQRCRFDSRSAHRTRNGAGRTTQVFIPGKVHVQRIS